MRTQDELFTEINQLSLRYMQDKIDIAKQELASAIEEGRQANTLLMTGITPHGLPEDLGKAIQQFYNTTIVPRLAMEREAMSNAVAAVIRRHLIDKVD